VDPTRRTGYRYLLEDLALSYAASGKALISAATRPISVEGEAVVVADPTPEDKKLALPNAQVEARVLAREYLREARLYVGSDLEATPGVLMRACRAEPAAASVLHLACHASAGNTLRQTTVRLAGEQLLPLADLIDQARRLSASAPGPLTVLSACDTASTVAAADESLSLANAFLAGGSAATISALWPIDGRWTASVMISFYDALRAQGMPPVLALRHAQLEAARGGPDHVKAAEAYVSTARQLNRSGSVPTGLPGPVDPLHWAAFVHNGQTGMGQHP
jgi:CHAT domain-containing protein